MKILIATPMYHPHIGGVEYVVKSVAERLAKMGHAVTVLAGEPDAKTPRTDQINGVQVIRWPTRAPNHAYHMPLAADKLREVAIRLAKEADVIHVHNIHAVFPIYVLNAVRDLHIRKVVTPYYHGTGHTPIRKLLWIYWRRHIYKLITTADAVHTVSKLEAQLIQQDFGRHAIPIENGVEEAVKTLSWKPENYAMYSGRVEKYKNIHIFAKIIQRLNTKYRMGVTLKIFGDGPYKPQLIRVLKEMQIPHEVAPFQPFAQYIQTLSCATLFGLLSQKESYPQSINEANAIGVPALTAPPWGRNFEGRTRTLMIDPTQDIDKAADEVHHFLQKAPLEPPNNVPTWDEVTLQYINLLYTQ
jgi:glycosyltransferase involved in cell wall biosynthesis